MNEELRDLREIMRDEMIMRDKILAVLKESPKSVPDIAKALEQPVYEVMFWVMAARKYGYLQESKEASDEGYYTYSVVERED
jgi:predicted Rossmann fold nucleotide-binding protein DprA/Smf involved in DNA uptake